MLLDRNQGINGRNKEDSFNIYKMVNTASRVAETHEIFDQMC